MADVSDRTDVARAPQDKPDQGEQAPGRTPGHPTVSGARVPDAVGSVGHTPGPNTGGVHAGGMSANDLAGGGAGGDIDHPDITGRGTTDDLTRRDSGPTGRGSDQT